MNEKNSYYKLLDLSRLYCALLIVLIHMGFDSDFAVIPCLSFQGVPFFFMVSGFFLSKKTEKQVINNKNLKLQTFKYIKSLLTVYFVWSLLWFPVTFVETSQIYTSPVSIMAVLFRRFFFAGFGPYWYLLVLVESALVLKFIMKKRWTVVGWILSALGLVLGVIYSYQLNNNPDGIIYKSFSFIFSWQNNIIMTGFPLLFLGAMLNSFEERIKKLNFWIILLCYIIVIIIAFILFAFSQSLYNIPFGIIQAVLLTVLSFSPPSAINKIPSSFCRFARNLSAVIYLTHLVFLSIFGYCLNLWNNALRFFLTIVCATVVYFIANKFNLKPLKTLLMIK